jgi:probable F420-dependent oxidoreductase
VAAIIPPGELVYGMQLPIQSQSTRYAQPWEASCGIDELAAIARACDRAGFFYVAVCDHVAIPRPHDEVMSTTWWDTLTTLGYLAAVTERTHLMSHVYVLPYRHPLMTAKGFLTLDAVSHGRAILGVGAGHVEDEFALLGADFAQRGKLLDEALDVVRAAFDDEYPVADGPTWPVRDAGLRPRPFQPGGPPIWVGGSSKPALRRAAVKGDGWLPQGPPEMGMPAAIEFILEQREAVHGAGVPIDIGVNTGPIDVSKPPEKVASFLRKFAAVGVNQLQVSFAAASADDLCDQIERFGSEIAPLLDD